MSAPPWPYERNDAGLPVIFEVMYNEYDGGLAFCTTREAAEETARRTGYGPVREVVVEESPRETRPWRAWVYGDAPDSEATASADSWTAKPGEPWEFNHDSSRGWIYSACGYSRKEALAAACRYRVEVKAAGEVLP